MHLAFELHQELLEVIDTRAVIFDFLEVAFIFGIGKLATLATLGLVIFLQLAIVG